MRTSLTVAADYILYIQVAGYTLEEIVKFAKVRSSAVLTFWTIVSLSIYTILFIALGYRIADLASTKTKQAMHYRLRSFQILSCAAPLIWAKLLSGPRSAHRVIEMLTLLLCSRL